MWLSLFRLFLRGKRQGRERSGQGHRRHGRRNRCHGRVPLLEPLEDRTVPAVWHPVGPNPLHDSSGLLNPGKQDLSGRIRALAVSPDFGPGVLRGVPSLFLRRRRVSGTVSADRNRFR